MKVVYPGLLREKKRVRNDYLKKKLTIIYQMSHLV
ncbi:hypothetical protein X975_04043, partial [Stegodyphus mimosarum]